MVMVWWTNATFGEKYVEMTLRMLLLSAAFITRLLKAKVRYFLFPNSRNMETKKVVTHT